VNSFRYKALTASGELREGVQEADSRNAVFRSLRRQGFWPVNAVELKPGAPARALANSPRRFPAKDLAGFFHELAMLIGSGIALDRALALLSARRGQRGIAAASLRLQARVRDGASLAQALAADPAFPKIAVGLVRAGEASGSLEAELLRLSEIMAKAAAIRGEIVSALIYPVILLATAGLAIAVIMVVVVPEFVPMFDDSGRVPPFAFRVLVGISQALQSWGGPALLAAGALVVALRWLTRRPRYRRAWDGLKLRLPLWNGLAREVETGRFCRTLGTLVKADVALPLAVTLAADAVGNAAIAHALAGVAKGLREGSRLVDRLAATKQLAPDVSGLLLVGEESGRLGDMLLRQAELSESKIRVRIARLLAIMVPAITLALGVVVAGIVTSLLVAILSINNLALH
jgi:general secretion pathway protein F